MLEFALVFPLVKTVKTTDTQHDQISLYNLGDNINIKDDRLLYLNLKADDSGDEKEIM